MSEGQAKRRWFQVRLRTILVCIGLVAIVIGWVMRGVRDARYSALIGELKIRDELRDKTVFDFADHSLDVVVDYVHDLHGIPVIVDEEALAQSGLVSQRFQFTDQYKGVVLSKALRDMLGRHGLSFMIKNGALVFTTTEAAKEWQKKNIDEKGLLISDRPRPRARISVMKFSLRHLLIFVTLIAVICGETMVIVAMRQDARERVLRFQEMEKASRSIQAAKQRTALEQSRKLAEVRAELENLKQELARKQSAQNQAQ